ncbi:hypothetical protein [Phenylobacterium sp. J367]|uniref:DUF6958 family protein n=1 Tax=Phenylobacterium sp. J367 TaxID=2898435 RepID=UPI002150DC4F|nr:hypothetical protein [Phenylobacterium sp. J367]MCR5879122.1 hypothetical protein [Phenylobacterium sp. J367]
MATSEKIEVLNPHTPGRSERVNAEKYLAMREAMLAVLPAAAPGATVDELKAQILPRLPDALFPGGSTAGWWLKCVQLDLEAREVITRAKGSPVRLYRL